MPRNLVPRYLASVDLSTSDDVKTQQLVGDIQQAAPTSAIVQGSAALKTSVTAIGAKGGDLAQANKTVGDTRAKLRTDIAAEAQVRSDLHGEIRAYAMLISNGAKSPADIHAAGLPARGPRSSPKQAPPAPDRIDNRPPQRGHGKTTVVAHDPGPSRHQFVAEQSLDGTTWAPLGMTRGKTRTVTGASGTHVWVRFATVRGTLQSDWSTPLQITIP